jgi:intein/homing endonuclease
MAKKIDSMIEHTPGGTAVFFPSYIVQNSIVPLMKTKNLLVQKENSDPHDIAQLIKRFGNGGVLCGPQGGSLSVDYEEPIIIKNEKEVFIERIGSFVNRMMGKNKILEFGGVQTSNLTDKYEVSAFNPKTFKISFKPISKVIRHKINEHLFELTTQTGRKIKATGSHSVFTLKNGKIQSPKVSELKEGDYLVIPKILPTGKNPINIDLLKELLKLPNSLLSNVYVRGIGQYLNLSKLKKAGHPSHWTYRDTLPIKLLKENVWKEKPTINELHIRWGHEIKTKIEVKKELFRLLASCTRSS